MSEGTKDLLTGTGAHVGVDDGGALPMSCNTRSYSRARRVHLLMVYAGDESTYSWLQSRFDERDWGNRVFTAVPHTHLFLCAEHRVPAQAFLFSVGMPTHHGMP